VEAWDGDGRPGCLSNLIKQLTTRIRTNQTDARACWRLRMIAFASAYLSVIRLPFRCLLLLGGAGGLIRIVYLILSHYRQQMIIAPALHVLNTHPCRRVPSLAALLPSFQKKENTKHLSIAYSHV